MRRHFAVSLACTLLLGCSGEIGGAGDGRGLGAANGSPRGAGPNGAPLEGAVGTMPLLRLTTSEYTRTLRALFGDDTLDPAGNFTPEGPSETGFVLPPSNVGVKDARDFVDASELIAARAVADVKKLTGCAPGAVDDACFAKFVTTFGRRAYRRPLGSDEMADLVMLRAEAVAAGADETGALSAVIESMLQSPSFLLKWEIGPDKPPSSGGVVPLTRYQLASRIAFLFSGRAPDDALNADVDAGKLATKDDVARVVGRYLTDAPSMSRLYGLFHRAWLGLDRLAEVRKDSTKYPFWSAAVNRDLDGELSALLDSVLVQGDGKLISLFTAPFAFVNVNTAPIYGATGITGTTFQKIPLDSTQRMGLLMQAAFMADTGGEADSLPPRRGDRVWKRVLCGAIGPVPMVIPQLEPAKPGQTTRQRFEDQHSKLACAQGCHNILDPIGFAFENFAGGGDYRTEDNGQPVDASGKLTTPKGAVLSFANGVALVKQLTALDEVGECAATQWYRYSIGRLETEGEQGDIDALSRDFAASGDHEPTLLSALAASRAFQSRSLTQGENW